MPDGVYQHFAAGIGARGAKLSRAWHKQYDAYRANDGAKATAARADAEPRTARSLGQGYSRLPGRRQRPGSRDSSQKVLNAIAPNLPWLLGGAADLAPSTKSNMTFPEAGSLQATTPGGRNMHFGIREHRDGQPR